MADTICAISTPTGEGGIAIVRVSGDDALKITKGMCRIAPESSKHPIFSDHVMKHCWALDADGGVLDEVMAVYMKSPRTYTGEDVCEIHCHGGSMAVNSVLRRAMELGARTANPGEFTRRAFMAGKIDLAGAEAVMQMISARTQAASRSAARQLTGGASEFTKKVYDILTAVCSGIEAANDFPDEIDDNEALFGAREGIERAIAEIERATDKRAARIIREGASVVIAGRPNAGKSSVMNAITGANVSIVTDEAGTTRDIVTRRAMLNGINIELSDTAGIRNAAGKAEAVGIEMARAAIENADVVVMVIDSSIGITDEDRGLIASANDKCIVVFNKNDIADIDNIDIPHISVSAVTGVGIDTLRAKIAEMCRADDVPLTAERHIEIAARAKNRLNEALAALDNGFPVDVAGSCAKEAMAILSEISGKDASEDVIDSVFSRFCVGK